MTSPSADELFAAGYGGSYVLDPKTKKRSLAKASTSPDPAPKNDEVRSGQSDPDQAGADLRS